MQGLGGLLRRYAALCALVLVSGCGGGLDTTTGPEATSSNPAALDADELALAKIAATRPRPGTDWQPPAGSTPKGINYIYLQSDADDPIAQGRTYLYTQANSFLTVTADRQALSLVVRGDETWFGNFMEYAAFDRIKRGLFTNVELWPLQQETSAGLSFTGTNGQGCYAVSGWIAVDEVEYEHGRLTAIVLRFSQTCDDSPGALRGKLRWSAGDKTKPPGPVNPPPRNLWHPPAGSTPATGNYVFLQADPANTFGGNGTRLYTSADAVLTVSSSGGLADVMVKGDENNRGMFKAMDTLQQLAPGYYGDLHGYPFYNPAKGGLDWALSNGSCAAVTGWFVVDSIRFANGVLTAIDLRFEERCESPAYVLRGKIHWNVNDPTMPPGPVNPPPADLWQPAAGTTPASGNYVYLQSDSDDYIGGGGTYTYTNATAVLALSTAPLNRLNVAVTGDQRWSGTFQAMTSVTRLQPGYYGALKHYPAHNPAKGGLDWSGQGRSCSTATGWFAIDSVTYTNEVLTSIDLRFEQHCEGLPSALRGKIHWVAGDTTGSPMPVYPPPADLWDAAAGSTPATGNYVYLQSDAGEYVGSGRTLIYTELTAMLTVTGGGALASVSVAGDQSWSGSFQAMSSLTQLQPGYYADLSRYPFHNPLKGGLSWSGDGRGCNQLTGWFVVDNVVYNGASLAALDLRFEQHCEGAAPALHGKIHWSAADVLPPPGPIVPPPAGLWQPAPGSTPASGNYLYVQSDPGEFIGAGQTSTITSADGITLVSGNAAFRVLAGSWSGIFQAMSSLTTLQPGYYGNLKLWSARNPLFGGLDWANQGRSCSTASGWVVIDAVTYSADALTAIDLRFEQHCNGQAQALHGQLHWVSGG